MLSVVCSAPGEIKLESREEPSIAAGEVKIKIRCVGLCGTDFHIFEGLHPYLQYPRVMGHELAGEVVAVASDSNFAVGDRVIVNPYIPCRKCAPCRKGKTNCCKNINVLGVHSDGGMCEYLCVPENQLYSAADLTYVQAAAVEFLAIGHHGVRRGNISAGDRVLVVGMGPIGIGAAIFAQTTGAEVAVLDANSSRIDMALSILGRAQGILAGKDTESELFKLTDGDMFDVVIDASGNKNAMNASLTYVGHGGSCVFISVVKDQITFDDPHFHAREMQIIGSRNSTKDDFDRVVQYIKQGLIPIDKLVTHQAPLSEMPKKLPQWIESKNSLIKAVATNV